MTAEHILEEWLSQTDKTNLKEGHYFVIKEAMKEYTELKCRELLEIVAEKAKADMNFNFTGNTPYVIKSSILNAVDLKNFIK